MASPIGEREARLECPLRVGVVFSLAALALSAMLLAACGGGHDQAKVEASLQQYLSTLDPLHSLFPVGAGPPRVRENGCKKIQKGRLSARLPKGLAFWSCVVKFGKTALPVLVAMKGSGEVSWAAPTSRQVLPPATVYTGGPEQPRP